MPKTGIGKFFSAKNRDLICSAAAGPVYYSKRKDELP